MKQPLVIASIDACVDHILDRVSGTVVLGIPLGIGKPNPLVNALYRRIKANPARRMRILTALSLEKPVGHSDLEKNSLQPLVKRVFEACLSGCFPRCKCARHFRGQCGGLALSMEDLPMGSASCM